MIQFKNLLGSELEGEYLNCIKPLVSVNETMFKNGRVAGEFIEYVYEHIDEILISPYPKLLEIAREIYVKFPIIQEVYARDTFFKSKENDITIIKNQMLNCKLNRSLGR